MKDVVPLYVIGKCAVDDEKLYSNMEAACERGLPEIVAGTIQPDPIAIVASGPSVEGQLQIIREMQLAGTPIVAVKDAHDWLIRQGLIPNYAFAVDPQKHRWDCFKLKHPDVQYVIPSQCDPRMFEHLEGYKVFLWHPMISPTQTRPSGKLYIGGATTSGLRAVAVFYTLGFRHFAMFGFDSCLDGDKLRVDGTGLKEGDSIHEVRLQEGGKVYRCNPSMALQAQHFQVHYDWMPDARFYPFGDGLLQDMMRMREAQAAELALATANKQGDNGRVSFIHFGDERVASWRYRAAIPAGELNLPLNDYSASTLIFAKPQPNELLLMAKAQAAGARIIVDFCDDHFEWTHVAEFLRLADVVTCPTPTLAERIKIHGRDAVVIPDPYEYPLAAPHCNGSKLLWYGHAVNRESLDRMKTQIGKYAYKITEVSNFKGAVPWSYETMLAEFAKADIVLLPATTDYKSANRAIEAIRQGCFVVAEDHPALRDIPGIWIGNIKEGIEWASSNSSEANERLLKAQKYVTDKYSPKTVAAMWKTIIRWPTTSDAGERSGADGSESMPPMEPILSATSAS